MAFHIKLPPIHLGAAYKKTFRWFTQDANKVRTPVDLTGLNGRIQLRESPGDPILADWSTANGKLVFDDVNRISIKVGRAETEEYRFDRAQWDLLVWSLDLVDEAEVLMYGTVDGPRTITDLP